MEHQVRGDGCAHEASIPYHRLVTELFVCRTQAADALDPRLPDWHRDRLDSMLAFTRDYRPDGLAPQIGGADDGRFLPLGDYGRLDTRGITVISFARPTARTAARRAPPTPRRLPVLRGGLYAIVLRRTGRYGHGGHSHNDQAVLRARRRRAAWIADPGTYLYTADQARNLFRSTRYHATLGLGGDEQNELRTDDLFAMEDRAQAELCRGMRGASRAGTEPYAPPRARGQESSHHGHSGVGRRAG